MSHVVPAFVFRWLRETSATGHIRFGEAPNLRVQDGWKKRWLCASCEALLAQSEKLFAERIFLPLAARRLKRLQYGPWLLKFCSSLSWRTLSLMREQDEFIDYSDTDIALLDEADAAWKDFVLGRTEDPGPFRQHVFLVDRVVAARGHVAPNINRHVLRHVDVDIVRSDSRHLVYTHLPRLFVLGVLRDELPEAWRGTEIHRSNGTIPRRQVVPEGLYGFVSERARHAANLAGSMSGRQLEKVESAMRSNAQRALESDTRKALGYDTALGVSRTPRRRR